MPMPGPMAARPSVNPAPIAALAAFASSPLSAPVWAMSRVSDSMGGFSWLFWIGGELVWPGSVFRMPCLADVDTGEDREDVRLQEADEHLEDGEEQEHEHRQDEERFEQELHRLGEEHRVREQRECHEEHVPG